MSKNHGYIAIHRKIFDNPISRKSNYLSIWLYIILKANHEDNYLIISNEKVLIKRGEFLGSLRNISEHFSISISSISKILTYLEKENMVKTKRTNKYTIFQVVNYDEYQKGEHKEKTVRKQKETNNNDNNDNNDNNIIASVSPKLEKTKKLKGMRFQNWLDDKDPDKITEEWLEWALSNTGWDSDRIILEMKAFQDYWNSKAGDGAIKMDWSATWRNWVRNAMKYEERGMK